MHPSTDFTELYCDCGELLYDALSHGTTLEETVDGDLVPPSCGLDVPKPLYAMATDTTAGG